MTTSVRPEISATDQASRAMGETDLPKANGPVLAALLASGIGAFLLGFFTTFAVISADFKNFLAFNKAVGPLAGKTSYAVAGWLVAWAVLSFVMRGKHVNATPFYVATFVLIGLGVLGTFPIFYDLFASK
jgi:hypothetical protein